jgi:hypothetical protein
VTKLLQREWARGRTPGPTGEGESGREELQRRFGSLPAPSTINDSPPTVSEVPPIVDEVLRSPGQPLDARTRAFMEPRFGHDFSRVRVHTDAKASDSAHAVHALAYTVGSDMVFGAGSFAPSSERGKKLMAHELTHTIQQSAGRTLRADFLHSNPWNEVAERQAEVSEEKIMQGRVPEIRLAGGFQIARKACLPKSFCNAPIPGSASEYNRRAEKIQAENERAASQAQKAGIPGSATAETTISVELTEYANSKMPALMALLGAVIVNPNIGISASAQLDPGCENLKKSLRKKLPSTTVGCIEVPPTLEDEAKEFKNPENLLIGRKWTRSEWEAEVLEAFTHEVEHGRFDEEPPRGTPIDDQEVFDELSELNSLLSEFPIAYRQIMDSPGDPTEKKNKLHSFISVRVENKDEGIRGIVHKMRCLISCDEVAEKIRIVFSEQSAGWEKTMKTEILSEMARQLKDWPILPFADNNAGQKSLRSTIGLFEFAAETYEELLEHDQPATNEEELRLRLREWMQQLVSAEAILRSELGSDSALMAEVRFEYTGAVQAAVAVTAKALKLAPEKLYQSNRQLIHECAVPDFKN